MAQRVRIDCINKTDRYNPHERIASVGGRNNDGTRWRMPESTAIARVKDGTYSFYVENPPGHVVEVVVARSAHGHEYLKTRADGEHPNNLLSLAECPILIMLSLLRDGVRHDIPPEVFWPWVRAGNLRLSDLVLDTSGTWLSPTSFPILRPHVPAPPPPSPTRPGMGEMLLKAAAIAAGGVLVYKAAQAVLDEDFGGRAFPEWFRHEKIIEHVLAHGPICPACRYEVRINDLTVDHIVPWAKGGLTSRLNAAVLCGPCNSRKRDRAGVLDYLRGRSG